MGAVRYENEELVDMLLIYGECHKNQRRAAALYAERFPERRHPGHGFFQNLCVRLCKHGTFHASRKPQRVPSRARESIDAVRMALENNPHTSTRAIGRDLQMNHTKVHRIIKKDLGWKPFKRHTSQGLFPGDFARRETFCDWVLNQIDLDNIPNDAFLKKILWTDECVFHSDGRINRHNEHHYAEENPHCRKTTHIQGYYSVNVWAGILDDMIIGPFFYPENQNVNGQIYADFIEHTLDDFLENVPPALRSSIIFQQDGHPAHTSIVARTILNRKFPNRWIGKYSNFQEWPPRSPDLTPLNFFLWGYLKDQVYQTLPQNRDNLINRIQTAFLQISPQMLSRIRESFVRRVVLCEEHDGGYFELEHLL